ETRAARRKEPARPDARELLVVVRHVRVFFSSRRRHTRSYGDWSSDVCSSDLFVLMLRARASTSSRSASAVPSAAAETLARRYGSAPTTSTSASRASPCTINRRLPSGSLNIL